MAYCSQSDILEVLPSKDVAEMTDDVGGVTIDAAKVTAAIARADNQINSYLRGKQNTLPLSPVPDRVKDWSVILAIFNLYQRRVNLEMPDPIRLSHDDVISELKAARDGKLHINDPDSPALTASFYKGSGNDTGDTGDLFTDKPDGTGSIDQFYNGPI